MRVPAFFASLILHSRLPFLCVPLLAATGAAPLYAQDSAADTAASREHALRIFLDCDACDAAFIKTELTFVNYVRDRNDAQVHILVSSQPTAGKGTHYTARFIGGGEFSGLDDTLSFVALQFDAQDAVRRKFVRMFGLGLARYAGRTPLGQRLSIAQDQRIDPTAVDDPWDNWVFSTGLHSFLSGDKVYASTSVGGSMSVSRVTPDWKLRGTYSVNYNEDHYSYETEDIVSISRSQDVSLLAVRSIDDHWSAGGWGSVMYSTYSNIALGLGIMPAVEYNIFPYSESTDRQLRLLYKVGIGYDRYIDTTIYFQKAELLFLHSLSATLEAKEPWGTASVSLRGQHYLHDIRKNLLDVTGMLSLKLFKGLSLDLFATVSRVHDQIALAKLGATRDEILLRRREVESQYSYYATIGLSYTFGSIYSNVVNPRFGSDSGGYSISISY